MVCVWVCDTFPAASPLSEQNSFETRAASIYISTYNKEEHIFVNEPFYSVFHTCFLSLTELCARPLCTYMMKGTFNMLEWGEETFLPPKAPHIGFFQVWPSSLPSPLPSARCPLFPQTSVSIFNAVEFFKKRNFPSDVSVVALCFKPLSCLGIVSKRLLTVCDEFCVRQTRQQWPSKTNQQPQCQLKGQSVFPQSLQHSAIDRLLSLGKPQLKHLFLRLILTLLLK